MPDIVAAARCYPSRPGADEEEYAERRTRQGAGPRLRAPAWTVRRSSPSEPGGTPPDGRGARVVTAGAAASRVVPREPGALVPALSEVRWSEGTSWRGGAVSASRRPGRPPSWRTRGSTC